MLSLVSLERNFYNVHNSSPDHSFTNMLVWTWMITVVPVFLALSLRANGGVGYRHEVT